MKRYGNLYEKICDIENIRKAHEMAKRGKSRYKWVKEVESNKEYYLNKIREMLVSETYTPSPYLEKTIESYGKVRNICALPYYPDRIIQWAIIQVIEPIMNKTLIYDTYSSIKGKGIHLARKKIAKDVKRYPYALLIDIHQYYASIDNEILKGKLRRLFKDTQLLNLLDKIIDTKKGLPIGNYTSQYFANYYLSNIDHLIKEKHTKAYYRYMDDMLVLGEKEELKEIHKILESETSKIRLNIKCYTLANVEKSEIDFCGYRYNANYIKLRNRIKESILSRLKRYKQKPTEHNKQSLCSVIGFAKDIQDNRLFRRVLCEIKQQAQSDQHNYYLPRQQW